MGESTSFLPRTLGRTGLAVGPLGIGSSYGPDAAAVEEAFEGGINYLYWGSVRRGGFTQALRNLKAQRERMVLVLQSYSRFAFLLERSVERGLRTLGFDYADVLLLGWWNRPVSERILERARMLVADGKVRHLAVSSHARPEFTRFAALPEMGILHVRYNAAHRGAEVDTFPHLGANPPGVVAYTATSWAQLLHSPRIPRDYPRPTAGDCYRFALSHSAVSVCMTGPSSRQHVRHALGALRKGPMDPEELNWMRHIGDAVRG